jgi:hypothetical protein
LNGGLGVEVGDKNKESPRVLQFYDFDVLRMAGTEHNHRLHFAREHWPIVEEPIWLLDGKLAQHEHG